MGVRRRPEHALGLGGSVTQALIARVELKPRWLVLKDGGVKLVGFERRFLGFES
jgi:hypothetical protein